ncbi:MAG: DUF1844 domain-containing protein [Planctomycetota bacterium]|jgi:hypothetical protein
MSEEPTKGKIHVDSDWKSEAQSKKEQLAAEETAAAAEKRGPLGTPTVADLLNLIAMPAAMALGGYRTPDGQTVPPDMGVAKYHIDLLAVLEEKTKGNLAEEEARTLATLLHQLRMQFTESATRPASAEAPAKKS